MAIRGRRHHRAALPHAPSSASRRPLDGSSRPRLRPPITPGQKRDSDHVPEPQLLAGPQGKCPRVKVDISTMRRDQRTRPPSGPGGRPRASRGHPGSGGQLAWPCHGSGFAAGWTGPARCERGPGRGTASSTCSAWPWPWPCTPSTICWATGNGLGLTSHGVNVLYGRVRGRQLRHPAASVR